ncbi:MAG: hypothetical protein WBI23_09290 [Methanothrix sp.]
MSAIAKSNGTIDRFWKSYSESIADLRAVTLPVPSKLQPSEAAIFSLQFDYWPDVYWLWEAVIFRFLADLSSYPFREITPAPSIMSGRKKRGSTDEIGTWLGALEISGFSPLHRNQLNIRLAIALPN